MDPPSRIRVMFLRARKMQCEIQVLSFKYPHRNFYVCAFYVWGTNERIMYYVHECDMFILSLTTLRCLQLSRSPCRSGGSFSDFVYYVQCTIKGSEGTSSASITMKRVLNFKVFYNNLTLTHLYSTREIKHLYVRKIICF